MIESGIIGGGRYEGETDGISVGKSASQTHETVSSRVKTKSTDVSGGWGSWPVGANFGASARSVSTTVDSERQVDQTVETTARDASQERRELLSYTTNIENVLTLLNAKHVGSPYLRFSLWPRPLHLLSLDPSDPNLWYHQLLNRRSRGIEGIQEFFAVAVIPKDEDFCIEARMKRFCVLDVLPKEPALYKGEVFYDHDWHDYIAVLDYLYDLYPRGTALEALDMDVLAQKKLKDLSRPVIMGWFGQVWISKKLWDRGTISLSYYEPDGFTENVYPVVWYKEVNEVFLEMTMAKYEEALARSPLERGKVLAKTTELNTCFKVNGEQGLVVLGPPTYAAFPPTTVDLSDPVVQNFRQGSAPAHLKHRQAVLRWNMMQDQLANQLHNLEASSEQPFRLDDPKIFRMFTELWGDLSPDDPLNLPADKVVTLLGLSDDHQRVLRAAGITDLRGLARTVTAVPRIQRYNQEMESFLNGLDHRQRRGFDWQPIELPITGEQAGEFHRLMVDALRRASPEDRDEDSRNR